MSRADSWASMREAQLESHRRAEMHEEAREETGENDPKQSGAHEPHPQHVSVSLEEGLQQLRTQVEQAVEDSIRAFARDEPAGDYQLGFDAGACETTKALYAAFDGALATLNQSVPGDGEVEQFKKLRDALLSDEAVQAAMDAAVGGHAKEGEEIPGDEIDFDAALRAAWRVASGHEFDLATSPGDGEGSGVELIAAERRRQVEAEGWTPEHDDQHEYGELAAAAAAYALVAESGPTKQTDEAEALWPFEDGWKPSGDPIRDLTKAGALIAAEIERLQREDAGR